ncbi:MAG: hypothetical protein CVU55_16175 [Deltaproteobacteria bacterium HGW-Deltaproteobacteria-13]|jgi:hypothetical protein|nr:MAG: hypothetical protein CVU55_16175 [Deltaproteobacteria bacterium HGW-Deltaproteobacteria-13]
MKTAKQKSWTQKVMQTSFALDLEPGVFTFDDPRRIAQSLKESAQRSTQRKAGPFQSAMSMLNYYINRAGTKLPPERKEILEQAKDELRDLFGRGKNNERRT